TRAIAVEVGNRDALLLQVEPCRRGGFDCTRRRDVIRGYRIAEDRKRSGSFNASRGDRRRAELLEVRRLLNVGRFSVPVVDQPNGRWNLVPQGIPLDETAVELSICLSIESLLHQLADFRLSRPDVSQVHRSSVATCAQRLLRKIDVDAAG